MIVVIDTEENFLSANTRIESLHQGDPEATKSRSFIFCEESYNNKFSNIGQWTLARLVLTQHWNSHSDKAVKKERIFEIVSF